ncbi:hypothetical protein VK792_17730 [Mesobacterium sp. TK19101]|uniref:Uncharacterized protein n=1 Tax=Mesobacterium hydrothermale TaxID=3111907 RepID=A0ABU6HLA2_9RHOB|nr:hypothetical protein [Mesobacterium sp. TK19101]MEC3863137.1 hypothetical protein [Mesobacterium sp. TK19101]
MDCILHIGTGKTGTSSLQRIFQENADSLLSQGYLYPIAGRQFDARKLPRHVGLRLAALPPDIEGNGLAVLLGLKSPEDRALYRDQFLADLDAELASHASAHSVIFSDEALYSFTEPEAVAGLKAILSARFRSVSVICYVRRPDRFLISGYSQYIKKGGTEDFDTYMAEGLVNGSYFPRLRCWIDAFGVQAVHLRCFEKRFLIGQDLVTDFLTTAGLISDDASAAWARTLQTYRMNDGLSAFGSEVLRRLNMTLADMSDEPRRRKCQTLFRNAASRAHTGKGPSVSPKLAQQIVDSFRDDHAALVSAFDLGPDRIYALEEILEESVSDTSLSDKREEDLHAAIEAILLQTRDRFRGLMFD